MDNSENSPKNISVYQVSNKHDSFTDINPIWLPKFKMAVTKSCFLILVIAIFTI